MTLRITAGHAHFFLTLFLLLALSIFYSTPALLFEIAATDDSSQRYSLLEKFDTVCELSALIVDCSCLVWAVPRVLSGVIALARGDWSRLRGVFIGLLVLFLVLIGQSILRWCLGLLGEGRGFQ